MNKVKLAVACRDGWKSVNMWQTTDSVLGMTVVEVAGNSPGPGSEKLRWKAGNSVPGVVAKI